MKKQLLTLALSLLLAAAPARGQNAAYAAYIDKYKDLAVEQMKQYGVPASITLAQGLLESGAGRSYLARKANNHFGIKCGSGWRGPYVLRDDDYPNEKFRAYRSARESYVDHSVFLRNGRRYAFLFDLRRTDYKGWARGLKKAGYATNPRYADNLIALIERYDLDRYDHAGGTRRERRRTRREAEEAERLAAYDVRMCNDNYYVVAREGQTFASIAADMGVRERRLREYNEVGPDYRLAAGDIVYFEKKRSKAARELRGTVHEVKAGESLHSIAQRYGMRLKTLYKLNSLPDNYVARTGDRLRIR